MANCIHTVATARKKCWRCHFVDDNIFRKFCEECGENDPFTYFCLECPSAASNSSQCPHPLGSWWKRCSICEESSPGHAEKLWTRFCSECRAKTRFQIVCSTCKPEDRNQKATGQRRPCEFHSTRELQLSSPHSNFQRDRGGSLRRRRFSEGPSQPRRRRNNMLESVFKLAKLVEELQSEPDQHSFFDFLHDSQCWIERTLSGVLDQSIPLETQEQQMKLMHELKKRQSLVIKVQSMGGKLAEENFGNKDLCAEIRKQIRDIGQKMSDLNEVVQQKMGAGYNQLAEAASIGPAKLCTPDQSLLQQYWQKFRDCRCWISALHYNMTRHCQIDDSQPSPEHKEVRRQRILQKLRKEIDSRSWTVENVRTLGYKLIEENRGNSVLRTDVKDQLGILIEEFNSLQDMAVHLWNDELRTFRCGHTERLDRESSLRRISDQFCSSCWPLASQVQANKLCQDGDRIRRTPVTADNEDTAVEYYKISDRVLRYALKEHNIKLEIRSIEKIKNPVLDKKLFNVYNEMHKKDCVPELLFHGTTRKNAEMIIQNGFKVGNSGMFGAGIYFATDSTKSAQYCRGTGIKSLLLCDVLLGKTMVCDAPKTSLTLEQVRTAGYDSVFARRNSKKKGGVLNDEYIVYRAEQATPRYLIKFGSECSIL